MKRLAWLLLAVLGCGDGGTGIGPAPPAFSISARGPVEAVGEWRSNFLNVPVLVCVVEVQFRADGGGAGAYAEWAGGSTRRTPFGAGFVGTAEITATELVNIWGSNRINSGQELGLSLTTSHGGSFRHEVTLRYRVAGSSEIRAVSHETICRAP